VLRIGLKSVFAPFWRGVTSTDEPALNGQAIRFKDAGVPVLARRPTRQKTVKSVAFKVRSDVTSAARYVAASNVSSTRFRPSR
jgi:hypothetical protein